MQVGFVEAVEMVEVDERCCSGADVEGEGRELRLENAYDAAGIEGAGHLIVLGFFFFQAEDGIRDYKVTGVQTCALPISLGFYNGFWWTRMANAQRARTRGLEGFVNVPLAKGLTWNTNITKMFESKNLSTEIGRASCRERV